MRVRDAKVVELIRICVPAALCSHETPTLQYKNQTFYVTSHISHVLNILLEYASVAIHRINDNNSLTLDLIGPKWLKCNGVHRLVLLSPTPQKAVLVLGVRRYWKWKQFGMAVNHGFTMSGQLALRNASREGTHIKEREKEERKIRRNKELFESNI